MEAPEYLDLDEIDFTDDISYSVTSLKSIPELCRRCESQNEERSAPSTGWNSGLSSLIGNVQKPTGIVDVHSKFRPVKRVSPLKHQPENPDSDGGDEPQSQKGECPKEEVSEKLQQFNSQHLSDGQPGKNKDTENTVSLGELEHYDLDMDEILDVPYIKSSQQLSSFTKVTPEKRILGSCPNAKGHASKPCSSAGTEDLTANMTQFCVLSPVKSSEHRKPHVIVPDQYKHSSGGLEHSHPIAKCGSVHETDTTRKGFLNRTLVESGTYTVEQMLPTCQTRSFHLHATAVDSKLDEINSNISWTGPGSVGERNHEEKKVKSILNIVREGQISLLPHLAADNLDKIHDENGNNLLHISASQGHAECLQHLTSLMGEDCLNERNIEKLTPAGLAIKQGQLECVRWMVSETEAIAELSCSRDHPSLIHYAACYGQEKILLWLLQFMQEQGISLDEVDKYGNSAVHIACQHGYLGCIQTLVEYGANVTIQNQAGEKPSQTAEHHGHTMCSRYLVVVETCMSLASQVVKLTKQLKEQTSENVTLRNHLRQLLEAQRMEGGVSQMSPSSPLSPGSSRTEMKTADANDLNLQKAKITEALQCVSNAGHVNRNLLKQKNEESDKVLRQLLGKEISETVCNPNRLTLPFKEGQQENANVSSKNVIRRIPAEKRELKLARLKQIMQRSLSESDSDCLNSEDQKNIQVKRVDKPRPLPIVENVECTESLELMIKKHTSATGRKFPFGIRSSKSCDEHSPSPTSESSDPDYESQYQASSPQNNSSGAVSPSDSSSTQKVTTSPKSALKSPSSKRKASQNLKLRVTFEEPVSQPEQAELELEYCKDKGSDRAIPQGFAPTEGMEQGKRPFGTFRSIMETLSGNQNNNNSSSLHNVNVVKTATSFPVSSVGRKAEEVKECPVTPTKVKNKTESCTRSITHISSLLNEEQEHSIACIPIECLQNRKK
ncbi:synphilin-1 isoform X2 [Protopterus annectens]|uniref:synphilin-1 isoform X2 n=1 Tax=Protopterus annectens TaxID=7888 RepID=UPI001CFA3F13|nr:synphilin-1 isoform X2 [Protopterus annectens]